MLKPSLAIACVLFAGPVIAQTTTSDPAGFGALSDSADEQVNVTADNLEVDENESQARFVGNVVVTQGQMRLEAPELVASYGEGGPSDLENFTTSGGRTRMETDDQTVEGDEAFYDFGLRVLTFSGNVVVNNASGTVNADRLVIDTRAGTSSFSSSGGGGGRVTSTFTPGG